MEKYMIENDYVKHDKKTQKKATFPIPGKRGQHQ